MEIERIEPFLDYFERVRARTLRVIAVIPADRFDWAPRAGAFSFADLIRHIGATERYMFAENAQRRPSRYPGCGPELADGPQEVLAFLDRMHRESCAIFGQLTPEDLRSRCETPGGVSLPVWKWLRSMIEHEIHHRGQIYLLLNLLEVPTPPLYGLTSEQVRERSLKDPPSDGAPGRGAAPGALPDR